MRERILCGLNFAEQFNSTELAVREQEEREATEFELEKRKV